MKYKSLQKFICCLLSIILVPFVPAWQVYAVVNATAKQEAATSLMESTQTDDKKDDTQEGNLDEPADALVQSMSVQEDEAQLAKMKLITENDTLALYIDETQTDIAIKVKTSGDTWFSNPVAAAEDTGATAYYQRQMKSQFSIRYYNENVQFSEMDNYNDSILGEQFEITYQSNGVTITYTLGEMASKLIIPDVISEERMDYYTGLMEEKAAKKVKRNYTLLDLREMSSSDKEEYLTTYPGLEVHNIYILKEGAKDYIKEELMKYFTASGYTAQDKENDATENGVAAGKAKPWFKIPLTYTLEKDNLLVSIDPKAIEYNTEGYYLVDIDLLQYFGVAGTEEEGYMFVPDGSGALIYLNNGKIKAPIYNALVYGEDKTLTFKNQWKSEVDENLTIKLPVFGLKTSDKAWFAIIEEGDGYADISAKISGITNSYNSVYAGFSYLKYGSISLDEIVGSNSFQMYSEPVFEGSYSLRYAFLHGEEADYSGMAAYYRDYLALRGELKKTEGKRDTTFFVEYIGAIEKYKSFLGMKHKTAQTLTTFAQAEEITGLLQKAGISNIKVKYSGWTTGGLKGDAITNTKLLSKLNKGGTSFKEYLGNMSKEGIPVYMDVQYQNVYQDNLFDGYNKLTHAPRYFDNSVVQLGEYYISTGALSDKIINLISPYYINTTTDKFISEASRYPIVGVNLGSISYVLYSDLYKSRYTDRQMAIDYNTEAMKTMAAEYQEGLLGDNANAYTLPYVNSLLNVPMDSNRYLLLDEVIPFYEMVVRGYIDFAAAPLNMSDDFTTTLLKSVESGAGIYFQWIYTDNSIIVDTDFDYLYSVNYKNWMDKAIKTYHKVNDVYQGLQGQTIERHEELEDGVYRTTYEKGAEIVVNYNKKAVFIDGITIKAQDFAIVKEGE